MNARAPTYYRVEDLATGELRIIIRDSHDGILARYDGRDRWVESPDLARWMGPGGDFHDGEVDDLPAAIQELETVWAKPMPDDDDVVL